MKRLCVACAVLLCAAAAEAQWVAPNTYVMPGMGYTQGQPFGNPYRAYYYAPNPYYPPVFVPPVMPYMSNQGSITTHQIGNATFYYGGGDLSGFSGQTYNYGNGYSYSNYRFRRGY
jgi:hypothetical protein